MSSTLLQFGGKGPPNICFGGGGGGGGGGGVVVPSDPPGVIHGVAEIGRLANTASAVPNLQRVGLSRARKRLKAN